MADQAASRWGVMKVERTQARRVVRLLLVSLLLQFSAPLPSLAGHLFSGQLEKSRVVICSEGGIHFLASGGSPEKAPKDDGGKASSDCCLLSCHIHGALLASPLAVSRSSSWILRLADNKTPSPLETTTLTSFEARAPPLSV
jgi:hypothetical protein